MFPLLAPVLARRGVELTHVNTPAEAFVADRLAHYDGLVIYGNHETMTPEEVGDCRAARLSIIRQEADKILLDMTRSAPYFVPVEPLP